MILSQEDIDIFEDYAVLDQRIHPLYAHIRRIQAQLEMIRFRLWKLETAEK